MSDVFKVSPLTAICGDDRSVTCRVGAIATDGAGRTLGLTARHVLFQIGTDDLFDLNEGVRIGRKINWPMSEPGSRKFFDTIAAFEIVSARGVMSPTDSQISGVASYEGLVGKPLKKVEIGGGVEGTVIGIGGGVRFVDPYDGEAQIFQDVVEVKTSWPFRGRALAGQAGSLFVDQRGGAVGLLICGSEDRLYLAPLQPFLRAHKLVLALVPGADANAPEMVREIQAARSGAAGMMRDIDTEPKMHKDPRGLQVPSHLLKKLERP